MVRHFLITQNSKFSISLQYLKKEVSDEVDFLHSDKRQCFLQVDFNTLGIQVSYKVVLSLLMGMISIVKILKVISLQYLKKEVRDGVHFLHADGHLEVERHVQSTQNRKFVIILQCIKKKVLSSHVHCYMFIVKQLHKKYSRKRRICTSF